VNKRGPAGHPSKPKGNEKMSDPTKQFTDERCQSVAAKGRDQEIIRLAARFLLETQKYKYTYAFDWLGHPII
jgi:cephalosporin hydroxylase